MKRTVLMALVSLVAVSLLSGCMHMKEFTQEELDLISFSSTAQTILAADIAV